MKKAAMKLSSLPLKMSVPYRNRTYNRVLGGPRYIHLTKGTNTCLLYSNYQRSSIFFFHQISDFVKITNLCN